VVKLGMIGIVSPVQMHWVVLKFGKQLVVIDKARRVST
jgi:hypothetical protein